MREAEAAERIHRGHDGLVRRHRVGAKADRPVAIVAGDALDRLAQRVEAGAVRGTIPPLSA